MLQLERGKPAFLTCELTARNFQTTAKRWHKVARGKREARSPWIRYETESGPERAIETRNAKHLSQRLSVRILS